MHISKWCLSIWVYIKIREGEISYVPVFAPPIERQSINPLSWKLEPSSKTPHLLITYCYCIVLTFVGTFSASSHTSALPLKSKSTASLERVHSLTQNQINVTFSDTESISCILFIKFRSYIGNRNIGRQGLPVVCGCNNGLNNASFRYRLAGLFMGFNYWVGGYAEVCTYIYAFHPHLKDCYPGNHREDNSRIEEK